MRRKSRTIRTKLMLFTSILISIILCLQLVFNIFLSKQFLMYNKEAAVKKIFYTIRDNFTENGEEIYELTNDMVQVQNLNILIFDGDKIIYSNKNNFNMVLKNIIDEKSFNDLEPFKEEPIVKIMMMNRVNKKSVVLTGAIKKDEKTINIIIETPVEAIDINVGIISDANLVISMVVLVIGMILAIIFSKKFSKPIQDIEQVAKNVSYLNFEKRADEGIYITELCDLSHSINSMSDNLKDMIHKLEADIEYQKTLDKVHREFIANVSHELKTPLQMLLLYSEGLKYNIDKIDKDYYCNTIIEETNKMNDMVKSLLDISSIENGLNKMEKEKINFSELLNDIIMRIKLLFKDYKVQVDIDDSIMVYADKKYLEQAILNYINNAIVHTQKNDKIKIKLKKNVFSVYNEGNTIDDNKLEHIWNSFYKGEEDIVNKDKHAGLGLYIVKTIVEAHSGKYGVRNLNEGVEFYFTIN